MNATGATEGDGPLAGRHIVLGVTGGIAAYKAIELCRRELGAVTTAAVLESCS